MFSALRQSNPVYILDKGENPSLRIGQVVSVSSPQQNFGQINAYTVDVTVNVNGENVEFKKLPASFVIATTDGLVVAESREAMLAEVEGFEKASKDALAHMAYHEKVVKVCKDIKKELNPQYAEQLKQAEKITALEESVGTIKDDISEIKQLLKGQNNKK